MSATGRGERGGDGSDFFPTESWCVDWLLRAVQLPGGHWLEPSAGQGDLIRAVKARRNDVTWSAVEIREDFRPHLLASGLGESHVASCDFLALGPPPMDFRYDVAIGNPPFLLAERFIGACRERARIVALLLRLGVTGSAKRFPFWRQHLADMYVLSDRPSFTGDGKTDSDYYAWFVWGMLPPGASEGRWRVLGPPESGDLFSVTQDVRR